MILFIGKTVEWVVLVSVLMIYLVVRSKHLHILERIATSLVSAGLAYSLSDVVSRFTADSDLLAAIAIMILGPMILNAVLTAGHNEDFIKSTLEAWVRKRLGLENSNDK